MAYQAQCEPSAIKQSITINSFSESIKIVKKDLELNPGPPGLIGKVFTMAREQATAVN